MHKGIESLVFYTSDLPAQAEACGIDYDNLVDMVLHSAGLNK